MSNLVELIGQISANAQQAGQPTDIVYGTVKTATPLTINIDQKTTLTKEFIVLTKSVSKHQVDMEFSCDTEESTGHSHKIYFKGKATINNQLNAGDKVVMIKQSGGQSYIVLDKIGG